VTSEVKQGDGWTEVKTRTETETKRRDEFTRGHGAETETAWGGKEEKGGRQKNERIHAENVKQLELTDSDMQ